jgi:hypothetical protein
MYECGGGGAGGGLKEESSFSEEKEAKRLLSIGPGWWPAGRAIGEEFFGSFFQERTLLSYTFNVRIE